MHRAALEGVHHRPERQEAAGLPPAVRVRQRRAGRKAVCGLESPDCLRRHGWRAACPYRHGRGAGATDRPGAADASAPMRLDRPRQVRAGGTGHALRLRLAGAGNQPQYAQDATPSGSQGAS